MEELLDEAYEHYVARKEGSTKQRKRAKQAGENQLLDVWTSFQLFFSCSFFFFASVLPVLIIMFVDVCSATCDFLFIMRFMLCCFQ